MQKLLKSRKYLLIAALTAIILLVCAALTVFSPSYAAHAEGNDAYGTNKVVEISLDLNGKDYANAGNVFDNKTELIKTNNGLHLSKRRFSSGAVAGAVELANPSDYSFVEDSCRTDTNAVSVSISTGGSTMDVEAKSMYAGARFSVKLRKEDDPTTDRTVYFSATVTSTFVQRASTGGWAIASDTKTIKVGEVIDADGKIVPNKTNDNDFKLYNFANWDFNLSYYLANRALYCKKDDKDNDFTQPIMMQETGSTVYWGIRSADNFTIESVSCVGITDAFGDTFKALNPTGKDDNGFSPTATMALQLTTDRVLQSLRSGGAEVTDEMLKNFWNSKHNIQIKIKEVGGNTEYVIAIPVTFVPSNPQIKNIDSSKFHLNTTSTFSAKYDGGKMSYYNKDGDSVPYNGNAGDIEAGIPTVSNSGYKSIIITPDDLVDYCHSYTAPADQTRFVAQGNEGSADSDYYLEVAEGNESYPTAYKIVANKNGQFSIDFCIEYKTSSSDDKEKTHVLLSVNGYGNYTVTIPTLQGKNAKTYNVLTDPIFKPLMSDHYQMTKVRSNNQDQLEATFEQNILKLAPRVGNIDETTRASITMTFTNVAGQTVEITSPEFLIDVTAGSFWTMFPDWQGWLIIAACIVGGLLIILFIVWIFIHSISKHKQEENATAAPVSSYIVKLNTTIAATQAQQRLAATQALSQASGQMLLGAGPTGTQAPDPNTLALATGVASTPQATTDSTPSTPAEEPAPEEKEEDYIALIAEYISDEELLERIFTEKYEPKGMVRRTFFKSKDLQARELDKEKNRIIERYKTPMPMDEAIMSESEIKKAAASSTPSTPAEEIVPAGEFSLGFDPDAPLYIVEEEKKDIFAEEKLDIDRSPEETRLSDVERQNEIIQKELAELKSRMDKVQSEIDKNKTREEELREKIAKAEADDEKFAQDIEDLEFKLASCKPKEKERINRDLASTEKKKKRNLDNLEKLKIELDVLISGEQKLTDIMSKLTATNDQKMTQQSGIAADLTKAKSDFEAYQDRVAKVKARQELEGKIQGLSPLLVTVNNADYEMRELDEIMHKNEKERESLKSDIAAAKAQILGANDFSVINGLNNRISEANARLSDIEKEITKATKRKSELNIEFTSSRRKANDFIEKNDIPLEDVIAEEDRVIGNIELEVMRSQRERDREAAERAVAAAQAAYDDISSSASDITMIAMEIASGIQELEAELEKTQQELDDINAQMETASDDEKLLLMVDQGDKSDKVEELKGKIEQANVDGTRRKMEAQNEYDNKLEAARATLDEATNEFRAETAKYDALVDTNPLDLIISGNGVISQDQKIIEANNLKKQLEKSKNEIEQARLAAQAAQEAAEQAKLDAERASDEARAEAERKAQEAIEKAEQARIEAEERAKAEAEAAEQARREAEEAAEQARKEAAEAAEQAKREAEEAAEQAKREAEEAAEQARREAEEAAEKTRAEAEQARKESEEAMRAETEEAKRKAQEEIDEMRRKAEVEQEAKRREEEERQKAENEKKEAIAKKIALRKERILVIRERMKDIKNDEDAKNLRESLYSMQLTFDEDEHNSSELMDFYNKTMDDIQHAGEVATLKAENAKKPQRVVKKVTERVNHLPKRRPGASGKSGAARRPGAAGARPRPGAAGARPRPGAAGARPRPGASGARPRPGSRPPSGRK